MEDKLTKFRKLLGEISDLQSTGAVLGWDQQTYMPSGGAEGRAMQLATISRLAHEKFISDEIGMILEDLEPEAEALDYESDEACLVRQVSREYKKQCKVPSSWVAEFSRVTTLAQQAWQKAKAESDFPQFKPHLEEIVKLRRQYAGFFAPFDNVYDPLLDDFEPGMKTAEVKGVFDELRPQQTELVRAIADCGTAVDNSMLYREYPIQKQWDFGVEVIKKLGFDFERGRQDKSAHPFTTSFGLGDVRITTHFDPNYIGRSLYGTVHEAGHAMYEQGIGVSLRRMPIAQGASLGIHESQSRMWENIIGHSHAFCIAFYPRLQEYFPENLGDTDLESFYRAINKVETSLIRILADEATYNLHIMLRFDIELALMEGSLEVAELPEAWNSKMEEYLGLTPPDDGQGVLQDVHWSGGMIGYFTTYALGNLIASMFWEKMKEDIPDIEGQIERAEFSEILGWLRRNIHCHGAKFKPMELIERVTGSSLVSEPYMLYLQTKFGEIYRL